MLTKGYQTFIILFFITLLGLAAFWLTVIVTPFMKILMGDFYILADVLLWIASFMLLSALSYRILVKAKPLSLNQDIELLSNEGFYYKFQSLIYEIGFLTFVPFIPSLLRKYGYILMGAKVGKGAIINTFLAEPYLIKIGSYAFCGRDSLLLPHNLTFGKVRLGEIKIGARVIVGANSIIMPGVEIGEGSIIAAQSIVTSGTIVPPNEIWGGVPARKIRDISRK